MEAVPAGREPDRPGGVPGRAGGAGDRLGGLRGRRSAQPRPSSTAGLVERIHLLLLPAVLDAGAVNLFEGPGSPVKLRLEGVERVGEYLWVEYALIYLSPRGVRG